MVEVKKILLDNLIHIISTDFSYLKNFVIWNLGLRLVTIEEAGDDKGYW